MDLLDKFDLTKKYKTLFNKYNINTHLRLSHFFGQLSHESNLKPIEENLRYSEKRLLEVFPKYFNATTAKQYAMQPQRIANRVYANRMGNGNEASGDGWKYRGKGFIQLTGKNNYLKLSNDTGVDYVNNPDLLLRESDALIASLWYWNKNNISQYADKDDILAVSRIINVGTANTKIVPHGMENRKAQTNKFKKIFEC